MSWLSGYARFSKYNDLGRWALFLVKMDEFENDTPFKPRHRRWWQFWRYY